MLTYEVVNESVFEKVQSVNLEGASKTIYNGAFNGNICICLYSGEYIDSFGQHSTNDFVDEYGFKVIEKD